MKFTFIKSISMRRLSSKSTFVSKRIFPVFWFGFLAVFVLGAAWAMVKTQKVHVEFFIIPMVMAGFGYFIMKLLVFDLVDEVWDDGDALVIRNKGTEERIELTNIMNVSHASFTNPPRITLMLREPCAFGKEITFSPPCKFLSFSSPIASELIERIDEKRRNG